MIRAFIAVDLPDDTRRELAAAIAVLKSSAVGASWVRAENLHMTMKFLGEIDERSLPELRRGLDRLAREQNRFTAQLSEPGFFPLRGRPRVLYVATTRRRSFQRLADRLALHVPGNGDGCARDFIPHITLARIRAAQPLKRLYAAVEKTTLQGMVPVCGLSLYRSILEPSGARYQRLHLSRFRCDRD